MATLAWLKKPMAAPDLPMKYVIAGSYAAFTPNDELWQHYLDELARLQAAGEISVDDYALLRYNITARSALMTETRGRPDAFSSGTIPIVLERARQAIADELRPEIQAEIAPELEADSRRRIGLEYDRRLRAAQLEVIGARRESSDIRLVSGMRQERQRLHIQGLADRWARRIVRAPAWVLGALLLVTIYEGLG